MGEELSSDEDEVIFIIGASDKDADWLKQLDGGAYQQEDLAAHEAAVKAIKAKDEQDGEVLDADV